jgi:hypothetical protein
MSAKLPLECRQGWHAIIEECHQKLLQIDPNYKILQIKEKFGGLRYYFAPSESLDKSLVDEMQKIAYSYEDRSWKVCEICGEEARTPVQVVELYNVEGWRKTRCLQHKEV